MKSVRVSNVPTMCSEVEILGVFSSFGEIVSVNSSHEAKTPFLEYHIQFANDEDAIEAVSNMHMTEFLGRILTCTIFES